MNLKFGDPSIGPGYLQGKDHCYQLPFNTYKWLKEDYHQVSVFKVKKQEIVVSFSIRLLVWKR